MKKILTIGLIALIVIGAIGYALHTNTEYNNGICPNCNIEYNEREYIYNGNSWIRFNCSNCNNGGDLNEIFAF